MKELRCRSCGKLLSKVSSPILTSDKTLGITSTQNTIDSIEVETKCSRCKRINVYKI